MSRSQATGHPKPGELKASEVKSLAGRLGNFLRRVFLQPDTPTRGPYGGPGGRLEEVPGTSFPWHTPEELAPPRPQENPWWVPRSEAGIQDEGRLPPGEVYEGRDTDAWANLMQDMGLTGDDVTNWYGGPVDIDYAGDLLWKGWFAADFDGQARTDFFEYLGWTGQDQTYLWDQWKEWYGPAMATA